MPFIRDLLTGEVSCVYDDDLDLNKNSYFTDPEHGAMKRRYVEYLKEEQERKRGSLNSSVRPSTFRIDPEEPILPANDGAESEQGQTCPNAMDRPDLRVSGNFTDDELDCLVARDSPFMNRLAHLGSLAKLRRCGVAECVENRKQLEKLAPRCEWSGFRDWALQLLSCQASLTGERRLARPFFHMSAAVSACHWLLLDAKAKGEAVSGRLLGQGKRKYSVEAFGVFELIYWMLTIQSSLGLNHVVEGRWSADFLPAAVTEPAVERASQMARDLGLCQSRLWNLVLATERQHLDLPGIMELAIHQPQLKHDGHHQCTAAFCRSTTVDSTKVKQLHKCPDALLNPCNHQVLFDPKLLNESISKGGRTAWSVASPFRVCQDEPYIAISHVWSDGTGIGLQDPGLVNRCLFDSFASIAAKLGCKGIWWDTISIPTNRELRKTAISNMHRNYAEAKCTVVHDEYLVGFEWTDDGLPCLALIFSPWLTRGWTALELIMSHTVKVLYKGADSKPVIMDLDKDILAHDPSRCTRGHWIASTIIRRLRQDIHNVSDLMAVLKPRSTSWPRDRSVIAALLSGVTNVDYDRQLHEITKDIVDKVAKLNPASLHHGQPTITESGGWSWCPPSLYDMPSETVGDLSEEHTVGDNTCIIDKHGVLAGVWYWRPLEKEDSTSGRLVPNSQHLSVVMKLRLAIRRWEYCMLLRESNVGDGGRPGLLVLPVAQDRDFLYVKFVGSVREISATAAGAWDSRYDLGFFKIGVEASRKEVKAAKFYKTSEKKRLRKPSSRNYRWLYGKLWMGNHKVTGQLLVARHLKDEGIIEGYSLKARGQGSNERLQHAGDGAGMDDTISLFHASTDVYLSDEPVFRVGEKSGRGVDGDSTDYSGATINRVKPEPSWPPMTIPAFDRTYESGESSQPYSKKIFMLNNGPNRHIFAALGPELFTPDKECHYKGIWTGVSPGYGPIFALFHQPYATRLDVIALTGDRSQPRGCLQFVVEDLSKVKRVFADGKWPGLPVVRTTFPVPEDMPPPDIEIDLLLVSTDEVVFMAPKNWVQWRRVSLDEYLSL